MTLELAIVIINAVGAIAMLAVGVVVNNMRQDIAKNGVALDSLADELREDLKDASKSVASLATLIAQKDAEARDHFATKDDYMALRERVHDLSESVTVLKTRANIFDRSKGPPLG